MIEGAIIKNTFDRQTQSVQRLNSSRVSPKSVCQQIDKREPVSWLEAPELTEERPPMSMDWPIISLLPFHELLQRRHQSEPQPRMLKREAWSSEKFAHVSTPIREESMSSKIVATFAGLQNSRNL